MQTRRAFTGLAILAIGLMLVWGIQASIAAPKGDNPGSDHAAQPTPGHGQGAGNGNGQGNGNGNGNGGGNAEGQGNGNGPQNAGPPDNPGESANPGNGNGNSNAQNSNGSGQSNDNAGRSENAGNGPANSPGQDQRGNSGRANGNAATDANQAADDGTPTRKVLVCHVTSSASKPFRLIKVDRHAVAAHAAHGDIVGVDSAADCANGTPTTGEGGATGSPSASPAASPASGHKVLVCHATSSASHPFELIEVDRHAVPAHEAHGDIIGENAAQACGNGTPVASPEASPAGSPTGSPVASPEGSPASSPTS